MTAGEARAVSPLHWLLTGPRDRRGDLVAKVLATSSLRPWRNPHRRDVIGLRLVLER